MSASDASHSGMAPPQHPPHIRLNSGTDNILLQDSPDDQRSNSARSPTSPRPLIPQASNSTMSIAATASSTAESTERLLPPTKSRTKHYRDDSPSPFPPSPFRSPSPMSQVSSRRSSWSSESAGSRSSRMGPFANPFDDSRTPSRAGSDDEGVNTQTVSEKYNILPSAGLLLFPEDVEKDDWLHNPDPNDKDRDCDIWHKRALVNVGGLAFITIGLFVLFIGYPVLTFVQKVNGPSTDLCRTNPMCIDLGHNIPRLQNVREKLIDKTTPKSALTRKSRTGTTQNLVFSDEFNTDGRTFYDGDDPYFQAVDIWYGVTQDLEWYDPDAVTTKDGVLTIQFDAFKNHGVNYRSGMLQSWNKLCFKGGHIEASISLPGRGDTIGYWPGFWTMGNLGRPGYAATTDGLWPYSYHHKCDPGITANQSQTDGTSFLPGMRLPACTCSGEDHPNPGKSRSAPEIDVIEASVGYLDPADQQAAVGSVSQSAQFAPFDIFYQPDYNFVETYDKSITQMNGYQGGVYQQAISGVTNLNNNWYDGKSYQTYAFEYSPGEDGYVTWYVGKDATWTLDARAIGPNGNVGQRTIPEEPMAIIANFGLSNSFANINWTGLPATMPATMRFDYIRIYQDEGEELVTCDPPDFPTTNYIARHADAYNNPNLTLWSQTNHKWPQNSFVNSCKSST